MCFSQNQSGIFALIGFGLSIYAKISSGSTALAAGVFYFFAMEALQYFQFFWINDCDSKINQYLTMVGYAHICFQPYFCHVINSALCKSETTKKQYSIVKKLCLIGGTIFLLRGALYDYFPEFQTPVNSAYTIWSGKEALPGSFTTREWMRGEELCTYKGNVHLAWSVPMLDNTYWIPGAQLHSFLMFVPFFVFKSSNMIQGLFLFLTGPFLSIYFTDNLQEQASIWCFFSICQIAVMLFFIRAHLILKKGKKSKAVTSESNGAKANGQSKVKAA